MKKEIFWAVLGLAAIIVIIAFFLNLSNLNPTTIILEDGMILDNDVCSKIEAVSGNKIILIHQLGCPHCAVTINTLREIEQEQNKTFAYYDLAIGAEREKVLEEMNILPRGVPTLIADCKVYVGQRTKEDYLKII